jgi:hypothetical protein
MAARKGPGPEQVHARIVSAEKMSPVPTTIFHHEDLEKESRSRSS